MLSQNTSYIPRLDHLRFFAALLVIAYHFAGPTIAKDALNPLFVLVRVGQSGVGLFMVLSGFILTQISLGKQITYRGFLFNRFVRIYPLYVLAIVVAAYTGGRMDVLSILAMLSTMGIVSNVALPLFPQIWTIAVEFQFYLIFPFLVAFLGRYGTKYIIGLIGLALLIRAIVYTIDGSVKMAAYWTIVGRIDQFCIGMLAAVIYAQKPKLLSSPLVLALSMATVYLWSLGWYEWTGGYRGENDANPLWIVSPTTEAAVWAFFALAYLQQHRYLAKSIGSVLSFLGSISFSLYVWHVPILAFMHKLPVLFFSIYWHWNFLFVVFPLTVTMSVLSYFIVEKPFFSLRKVYVDQRSEGPRPIEVTPPASEGVLPLQAGASAKMN